MLTEHKEKIDPVSICGKDCITIGQFAKLTKKSESSIRQLIIRGNMLRKIETITAGNKPFIPVKELFEYPFVMNGRPNELGYLVVKHKLEGEEVIPFETFEYSKKYKEGADE